MLTKNTEIIQVSEQKLPKDDLDDLFMGLRVHNKVANPKVNMGTKPINAIY